MRKLLPLLLLIAIVCISCDGRDRAKLSNAEVLKQHNLLESFSKHTEFIPKHYTEVVTDTILSNGYKVKIKTFSDMTNSITKQLKKESITHNIQYREFISEVSIFKDEKLVFNETIDDSFLKQYIPNISKLNSSITKGLAINEEKSLETNTIHLAISNCIPDKTINCPSYYIIIDEKGHFKIKQTNHAWT
ncbi:hypothetical protein [Pontimicrobium sp. MEBiC01747]|jgi:hypothetical protein